VNLVTTSVPRRVSLHDAQAGLGLANPLANPLANELGGRPLSRRP
jgi:hypothetical protein